MGSLNWVSGLTRLGCLCLRPQQPYFLSLGLTNKFTPPRQSDRLVLAPYSGSGRTYPFSLLESLFDLSRRILRYSRTPVPRGVVPIWGIPRFQAPGLVQTVGSTSIGSQGGHNSSVPMGSSAHGLPGYGCYEQHYSSVIYQQTHSHSLLHLILELFLWLHTQDIAITARHIPACLIILADRLSWPNQRLPTEWALH